MAQQTNKLKTANKKQESSLEIHHKHSHDLNERVQVEEKIIKEKFQKELKHRADHARLIYEVGQRVSSKLNQEELLSEIVNSIYDAFNFYGVMLLMLDDKTKRLNLHSNCRRIQEKLPSGPLDCHGRRNDKPCSSNRQSPGQRKC